MKSVVSSKTRGHGGHAVGCDGSVPGLNETGSVRVLKEKDGTDDVSCWSSDSGVTG